jgi:hypothetical protein
MFNGRGGGAIRTGGPTTRSTGRAAPFRLTA